MMTVTSVETRFFLLIVSLKKESLLLDIHSMGPDNSVSPFWNRNRRTLFQIHWLKNLQWWHYSLRKVILKSGIGANLFGLENGKVCSLLELIPVLYSIVIGLTVIILSLTHTVDGSLQRFCNFEMVHTIMPWGKLYVHWWQKHQKFITTIHFVYW